jgi:hypothetical protein
VIDASFDGGTISFAEVKILKDYIDFENQYVK